MYELEKSRKNSSQNEAAYSGKCSHAPWEYFKAIPGLPAPIWSKNLKKNDFKLINIFIYIFPYFPMFVVPPWDHYKYSAPFVSSFETVAHYWTFRQSLHRPQPYTSVGVTRVGLACDLSPKSLVSEGMEAVTQGTWQSSIIPAGPQPGGVPNRGSPKGWEQALHFPGQWLPGMGRAPISLYIHIINIGGMGLANNCCHPYLI